VFSLGTALVGRPLPPLGFSFNGLYTMDAIYKKIERLGLEVVDEEKKPFDYYF
jgi:hypothetical protein